MAMSPSITVVEDEEALSVLLATIWKPKATRSTVNCAATKPKSRFRSAFPIF
jgi:hypothetical protein